MAAQGGPPFFSLRGGCAGGKVGLRTTLPPAHPTPPPLPVPHPAQTKFPRVINFDSPLNDSRQLEWPRLAGGHPCMSSITCPGPFLLFFYNFLVTGHV